MGKTAIIKNLATMLSVPCFALTVKVITEKMLALFAQEQPLDMEDCWLPALDQAGQVTEVITFDKALPNRLAA